MGIAIPKPQQGQSLGERSGEICEDAGAWLFYLERSRSHWVFNGGSDEQQGTDEIGGYYPGEIHRAGSEISPATAKSVGHPYLEEGSYRTGRNILVLASSDEIQGDIVITGHPQKGLVTILGYKNWRRDAESRDLDAEQLIRSAVNGDKS